MGTRPPDFAARRPWRVRVSRELSLVGLLVVVAAAAAAFLVPRYDELLLSDLKTLKPGDLAPRTVKSPRTFSIPDRETKERLERESAERVKPTYDWITGVGVEARERIEAAFRAASGKDAFTAPQLEDLMRTLQTVFDDEQRAFLVKTGFSDELRDATILVVRTVLEQPVVEDKELLKLSAPDGVQLRVLTRTGQVDREDSIYSYVDVLGLDEARVRIDRIVADKLAHLDPNVRRATAIISKRLLRPNLVPNERETQRRREQAVSQVKDVFIHIDRGEAVLRARQVVTPRQLLVLAGIEDELAEESRLQVPVGSALLVLLLLIALDRFRPRRGALPSRRDFAFWTTAYVTSLLVVFASYEAAVALAEDYPFISVTAFRYATPIAFVPLLIRFFAGRKVAFALVPLIALTSGWVMDGSLPFAAYALMGGLTAAAVPDVSRPRSALFRAGFVIGFAQAAIVVALALLQSRLSGPEVGPLVGAALVSGLFSSLLTLLTTPLVEVLFGLSSPLRFASLANLNHPLLKDLLVQAPGTYHHSIVVGVLAEAGARAIGADPLLARVGGYYHDIGKRKNPRVFSENGLTLEALPPAELAKKIKQHIADGLLLGAEHRLAAPVLEIIAQHHGTGRVRRPFERAQEAAQAGVAGPALESDFSYGGPPPTSKEAALVMFADIVETMASELALESNPPSFAKITAHVAAELVAEGQLMDSQLTLSEIRAVAGAMAIELSSLDAARKGLAPSPVITDSIDPRFVVPASRDDRPN